MNTNISKWICLVKYLITCSVGTLKLLHLINLLIYIYFNGLMPETVLSIGVITIIPDIYYNRKIYHKMIWYLLIKT